MDEVLGFGVVLFVLFVLFSRATKQGSKSSQPEFDLFLLKRKARYREHMAWWP
ncbi:hypothetical protein Droror1_Dr00018167 [Drosera rotundifolia]